MNAATITHRSLASIDLIIIGIYFLIIFSIGLYFALKERTTTDYFLASRNIGWFAIGASLFVSNISTEHFIGLAGSGAFRKNTYSTRPNSSASAAPNTARASGSCFTSAARPAARRC